MRGLKLKILAGALAATMLSPAQANEVAPDDKEIVVQGRKSQKEQIRDFVGTLTPTKIGGQIGRFELPVCPAAVGLPDAQNRAVEERIRDVAKAVGARVARDTCTPNLFVIVTGDKAAKIAQIRKVYPGLVKSVPEYRFKAMLASDEPSAAWQIVSEISSDGTELQVDTDGIKTVGSADFSRLRRATVPHFLGAVVVVEASGLGGVHTRQLADYAAMRTLAPIDPLHHRHALSGNDGGMPPAPSILTLLAATPIEKPPSVTWWDFAFLKALYDTSNIHPSNLQRADMHREMEEILSRVPVEDL